MKRLKWIKAWCRTRIMPRWKSFALGWDPDVESTQRVGPLAEWRILAGLALAFLFAAIRRMVDGWCLHPLAPQFLIYLGIALAAAGWRTKLTRWIWRCWRRGGTKKLTKSEMDGALQLSYVLTTAGGLSMISVHSRLFAILVAGNIFAGIIVLDAARQLTQRQMSEDGITYAVINTGVYRCVRHLLMAQVMSSMLALMWLLVRKW